MAGKKKKGPSLQHIAEPQIMQGRQGSPFFVPKWAIVLLLVLTAAIYTNALRNGITFIDDDEYILKNPYIRNFSLEGIKAIFTSFYEFNYHPFTTLTWLFEYRLFGTEAMPYHAVNVILHLVNTWLVYRLAIRLSRSELTGIVVAALFAIHPMHVESVAWISERKGLLCGMFYFLSLLYYVRYVDDGLKRKYLIFSGLFFIAALFSKSAAVTLPVVALAIDMYRGRKWSGATIVEKVPFLLLSVVFGVLAIMSQKEGGSMNSILADYGIVNRVCIFTSGLAFYFIKAVVPFHLSAIHYFPNIDGGKLPPLYYLSVPFLLLLAWLIARKSSFRKEVLFGVLFFLVVISVMLQVVPVGAAYASERYTYVSYFGLFYIAGQWLSGSGIYMKKWVLPVLGCIALAYSIVSWKRIEVWHGTESVFTDLVEKNEGNHNNYLVHFHWADYYESQQRPEQALEQYDKSIEINPDYQRAYIRRGELHDAMGNYIQAILNANEVIRLNPRSAMGYNNKGWAYFEMGDRGLSVACMDTAIALDSNLAIAYNSRGWMKLQSRDSVSAMKDFNQAILKAPTFTKAYYNRALIKVFSGDRKGAIDDYTRLIAINPRDATAFYYRGVTYADMNNRVLAEADLRRAAMLGNPDADNALMRMRNAK